MARPAMVTRTITATEVVSKCIELNTDDVFEVTTVVPRTYENEAKLLKAVKEIEETDSIKVIAIISTNVIENLYGMAESEFVKLAKILPPRKANEVNE